MSIPPHAIRVLPACLASAVVLATLALLVATDGPASAGDVRHARLNRQLSQTFDVAERERLMAETAALAAGR